MSISTRTLHACAIPYKKVTRACMSHGRPGPCCLPGDVKQAARCNGCKVQHNPVMTLKPIHEPPFPRATRAHPAGVLKQCRRGHHQPVRHSPHPSLTHTLNPPCWRPPAAAAPCPPPARPGRCPPPCPAPLPHTAAPWRRTTVARCWAAGCRGGSDGRPCRGPPGSSAEVCVGGRGREGLGVGRVRAMVAVAEATVGCAADSQVVL